MHACNPQLAATTFQHPAEVVRWMGVVEALDHYGVLWAPDEVEQAP